MEETLRVVEELLRDYGHVFQANLAMIARDQFARSALDGCRTLNDDAWWGGRDSIAAIDLAVEGGYSDEARRDAKRLRVALIEIYTVMKDVGEINERAEIATSQSIKWVVSGI